MRLAIVVVTTALLAGCALDLGGTAWKKSGAMFHEVTAVEIQCARTAFETIVGPDLVLGGLFDVARAANLEATEADVFSECMTAQGYARVR